MLHNLHVLHANLAHYFMHNAKHTNVLYSSSFFRAKSLRPVLTGYDYARQVITLLNFY